MKNLYLKATGLCSALVLSLLAGVASAEPTTPYDDITAAVDFTDVITGIVAVAVAVAAVLIVWRGVRMLLAAIKR